MSPTYSVMAEVEATDLFEDESINWQYCVKHASFTHNDADVCEFIIHSGNGEFVENVVKEMKDFGCTQSFIEAYKDAAQRGVIRVMFWA